MSTSPPLAYWLMKKRKQRQATAAGGANAWILQSGYWADASRWKDDAAWKDS